jgi:Dolichyl-phosphate-mannose-protein mannosyltransferase
MTPPSYSAAAASRRWARPLLAVCLLAGLALSARGFGDERYVSLQGDMPRHLMNGVFFLDLVRDLPAPADAFEYARYYYARYPALSLGHHPFLIALVEAPFFAVFGVSVTTARLVPLLFMLLGVYWTFRLALECLDDAWAAAAAGITFASSAYIVELTQSVMTELPALSLSVAAALYCHRFAERQRSRDILVATLLAAFAAWAKQLAVVVTPALIVYVWWRLGWRRLLRRDVLVAVALAAAVAAPLVPITLVLSPFNVALAAGFAGELTETGRVELATRLVSRAALDHMTPAVIAMGLVGVAVMIWRGRAVGWLAALWIASTAAFISIVVAGEPSRYAIYWVPAWALGVGAACSPLVGRARAVLSVAVVAALATQVAWASQVRLPGLDGYEAAARHVVAEPRGSTVMFAGDVDTGYFTFFVRKHDAARRTIVLRADKMLTTSFMGSVAAEDRIKRPEEVRAVIERFGVGYIVVEDRPSESKVQNWLLQEVTMPGYIERMRLPSNSTDVRLRGRSLVVYEVADAQPAAADARLDIRLPLVSQQIDVAVADLVARKYLR